MQDARDPLVEQLEVVAHHQQRAPIRAQEADEPCLRVGVEVVRGLVEEQELAPGEQDSGELDPPALTTGKRSERQVETVVGQAEAAHDLASIGLRDVPAGVAEGFFGT